MPPVLTPDVIHTDQRWDYLIKEKLRVIGLSKYIVDKLDTRGLQMGYRLRQVSSQDLVEDIDRYLCLACDHIVKMPVKCEHCEYWYCADCAAFLQEVGQQLRVQGHKEATRFLCISYRCIYSKKLGYLKLLKPEEKKIYDKATFMCAREFCEIQLTDKQYEDHVLKCIHGDIVMRPDLHLQNPQWKEGSLKIKLREFDEVELGDLLEPKSQLITFRTHEEAEEERRRHEKWIRENHPEVNINAVLRLHSNRHQSRLPPPPPVMMLEDLPEEEMPDQA